jgi:hypothetical protein
MAVWVLETRSERPLYLDNRKSAALSSTSGSCHEQIRHRGKSAFRNMLDQSLRFAADARSER